MDFIALLIIGYVIYGVYKNYQKQKKKLPGAAEGTQKEAGKNMTFPEAPSPPAASESLEELTEEVAEALFQGERMKQQPQAAALEEGNSRVDAEGCVGGSLDHGEEHDLDTHSNRSIRPELPTVKVSLVDAGEVRLRNKKEVKPQAVQQPRLHSGLSAVQLRQAVVMSEILDKPVAMRRGRRYGVR